jgi:hypothetical protein
VCVAVGSSATNAAGVVIGLGVAIGSASVAVGSTISGAFEEQAAAISGARMRIR